LISKANLSRCVLHVLSHGQAAEEGVGEIKGKGVVDIENIEDYVYGEIKGKGVVDIENIEDYVYDRDVAVGEMAERRCRKFDEI
jgi:hypothetical protein